MANIVHRWASHNAHVRLGVANIDYGTFQYTAFSEFTALPLFGPVRDIEIDEPWDKTDQTAGFDFGHHEIHTRGGIWSVRIGAMQDAAGVFGDSRFYNLSGITVEFLVQLEANFHIVKGLGKFAGRVILGAQQGETMMRDVEISRCVGGRVGDLVWADLSTGVFPGTALLAAPSPAGFSAGQRPLRGLKDLAAQAR